MIRVTLASPKAVRRLVAMLCGSHLRNGRKTMCSYTLSAVVEMRDNADIDCPFGQGVNSDKL